MNLPHCARSLRLDVRVSTYSVRAANLNAHPRRIRTCADLCNVVGADSGVAEMCSFHPWTRDGPSGGLTRHQMSSSVTSQSPAPCADSTSRTSACRANPPVGTDPSARGMVFSCPDLRSSSAPSSAASTPEAGAGEARRTEFSGGRPLVWKRWATGSAGPCRPTGNRVVPVAARPGRLHPRRSQTSLSPTLAAPSPSPPRPARPLHAPGPLLRSGRRDERGDVEHARRTDPAPEGGD